MGRDEWRGGREGATLGRKEERESGRCIHATKEDRMVGEEKSNKLLTLMCTLHNLA